jgi:gamma-glutamylcyclotransferase (GGCT)/AIG2-like uncharacterized protein YtfP
MTDRPSDPPARLLAGPVFGAGRAGAALARRAPLFVYGTLLFDEITEALLGRALARRPATVPGWRVAALIGVTYPALVARAGAGATGELLTDLSADETRILDAYEGSYYGLALLAAADATPVWTYVRAPAAPPVAAGAWSRSAFARDHLAGFLASLTGH